MQSGYTRRRQTNKTLTNKNKKQKQKHITQYESDTTMRKQTQITLIRHPTNNWRKKRTAHRFHEEIVADSTTWNSECKRI